MRYGWIFGLVVMVVAAASVARGADFVKYIPGASSAEGRYGTSWSTDLWIAAHAVDGVTTVYASFVGEHGPVGDEVAIEVGPRNQQAPDDPGWVVRLPNAVMQLFGLGASGAIRLRSAHPFEAWSRTSTRGAGGVGSFGQAVPAVTVEDMAPPFRAPAHVWALMGAGQTPGPDGVRTNIGFVNPHVLADLVSVAVYDPVTRTLVGDARVTVPAGGWIQRDLFRLIGAAEVQVESAWVEVSSIDHPLFPYLSRLDNVTGDAVFIEPHHPFYYRTDPVHYTVEYSLDLGDGETAEWLEYTAAGGATVRIEDPPDGWSAHVELWSFDHYSVCVTLAPPGGTVTLTVTILPDGGDPTISSASGSLAAGDVACNGSWLD